MEEFSLVDETDTQAAQGDPARSAASLEKWGWIMFECGIENLTVKGKLPATRHVGAERSTALMLPLFFCHRGPPVRSRPL